MKKGIKFKRVKISQKEYKQLKEIEETITSTKIYKRIQAFKLIHKGWKYSAIAEFLNISKDTMTDWIDIYKVSGIYELIVLKYKGRQHKLNKVQIAELREKAIEGNFTFAKEIKEYIKKNFGVHFSLRHVQLLSKKNFIYPLKRQN